MLHLKTLYLKKVTIQMNVLVYSVFSNSVFVLRDRDTAHMRMSHLNALLQYVF